VKYEHAALLAGCRQLVNSEVSWYHGVNCLYNTNFILMKTLN